MELKHHNRFFRYLSELRDSDCLDEFHVTKEEVNIIMDILVHDSLSRMFPELVETALANLAQMRNRNSLGYTFKTHNLEDMLDEYKKHKKGEPPTGGKGPGGPSGPGGGTGEPPKDTPEGPTSDGPGGTSRKKDKPKDKSKDKSKEDETKDKPKDKTTEDKDGKDPGDDKGHASGGTGSSPKGKDDAEPEVKEKPMTTEPETEPEPEHDKTDWSKLKEIDSTEFIDEDEADYLMEKVEKLKRKKFKLARLTETLNGLATTTKARTYSVPSYMNLDKRIIMKGKRPGKTALYLCFDASGSMGEELETFKEIISKSIPHAMNVPCEWFSGHNSKFAPYKREMGEGYYKGTFKDMMTTFASSGFDNDGDRTIALCLKAEELGYSPIGVTDGGGGIYDPNTLKKLKRTILIGHNERWLKKAQEINPRVQILDI